MKKKKTGDFIGFSNSGIQEAFQNAVAKAGWQERFEVVETRCSKAHKGNREYQVTLKAFAK